MVLSYYNICKNKGEVMADIKAVQKCVVQVLRIVDKSIERGQFNELYAQEPLEKFFDKLLDGLTKVKK